MGKKKKIKMGKFDYRKWIAENKHGNNTWDKLFEQGTADFKEQTTSGSGSTGGSTGSGSTGGSTGSGSTGSSTGSGTTGGSTPTGSGTTGSFDSNTFDSNTFDSNLGMGGGRTLTSGSISTQTAIQGGPYPQGFNPQSWFEKFKLKIKGFKDQKRLCKYLNGLIQTWTVKMNSATTGPATDNALLAKIQLVEQLMNEYGCDDMREMYTYENTTGEFMKNEAGVCGPGQFWSDNIMGCISDASTPYPFMNIAPTGTGNDDRNARHSKMRESKIFRNKKRITKNKLKNIIKEELKKSFPDLSRGVIEQYSGEGCQTYLATSSPECIKCNGYVPSMGPIYSGFNANMTGPQCQCCDDERVTLKPE